NSNQCTSLEMVKFYLFESFSVPLSLARSFSRSLLHTHTHTHRDTHTHTDTHTHRETHTHTHTQSVSHTRAPGHTSLATSYRRRDNTPHTLPRSPPSHHN